MDAAFNLPARWPLVPVDVAAFYLNRRPEAVARDCDALWAWDIAGGGAARRQLRLWRQSLIAAKHPAQRRHLPVRLDQVIDSFLPRRGLRGRELQDVLFCTAHHIKTLEDAGLLQVERARRFTTGPNSSHIYTRQSVRQFLVRCSTAPRAKVPLPPLHPHARN